MLLVLTSTEDATADYLCTRLQTQGLPFLRIDTDTFAEMGFVEYGSAGVSLWYAARSYTPDSFLAVWYRRPCGIAVKGEFGAAELLHTSREWGASLDGFLAHIDTRRWINHPAANARASSKLLQLSMAHGVGIMIPETIISRSSVEAQLFFQRHNGSVVIKPLSVGYVEAPDGTIEAQIYTSALRQEHLHEAHLLRRCPTLLQQRVEKGADVRITIVDRLVTAISFTPRKAHAPVDIRECDPREVDYACAPLPVDVRARLLRLIEHLELRFAAVDMIWTAENQWVFLEVNPNGQWAWMDLLGGSDIAATFVTAFQAALAGVSLSHQDHEQVELHVGRQ